MFAGMAKGIALHPLMRSLLRGFVCLSVGLAVSNARFSETRGASYAQETGRIERGRPIEREIGEGQTHRYELSLTSDQYMRLVVDHRELDLAINFFGPDAEKLAELDTSNSTQGPESIETLVEAAGVYRLELVLLGKRAAPGRYEVRVAEMRPAEPQDKNRISAQKAFGEARRLTGQRTEESSRGSIAKFEEALSLRRAAHDLEGEALTLNTLGWVYFDLGERQKALDCFNKSLPICRSLDERRREAYVLNSIAAVYDWLGEKQTAIEYFNRSVLLWRAAGYKRGEAYTLQLIGLAYMSLGEHQKVLDLYQQALQLWAAAGYRRGEASTLNNLGALYYALGDGPRALEFYDRALLIRRELGDRLGEAQAVNNIGLVHRSLGKNELALGYYNQALEIHRILRDRRGEAITLGNIGSVYGALGEHQAALEDFNRALELDRARGDRGLEATHLNDIGWLYRALGDTQKALDYFNQALPIWRATRDYAGEAVTLTSMARCERDLGNLIEARGHIEASIQFVESLRAKILSSDLRVSYLAAVSGAYGTYIDVLMGLHNRHPSEEHAGAALAIAERSRARSLLETLSEAQAGIRQGVDDTLLERGRLLQRQLNAKAEIQTRLIGGRPSDKQVAEIGQEINSLTTEYQEVQAQIRARSPRYAALTQPQPLGLKEIQALLDPETLLLEYALGSERSYVWAVTSQSIEPRELAKREDIEAAALRVYGLLTARQQVAGETEQQMRLRISKADAEWQGASESLSKMVLEPVALQLGAKRLLIVAEGSLQYVPFASLPTPVTGGNAAARPPLIANHEIVNIPSASVLAVLRRETAGRKLAEKAVAVLADPVFDKDDDRVAQSGRRVRPEARNQLTRDLQRAVAETSGTGGSGSIPRLPFSRVEAEAILGSAPAGKVMKAVGFRASRATATSPELAEYRIVHFATHGLLNNEHPELSGIVLSLVDEQGRPQDGFLRLHELYNLNLPVELVVLSACQTGLGKEVKGEGLVGLVRGFMYAGAPRVVASQWKVDDWATAELMKQFYGGMLKDGMRPAAALRAAQVRMLNQKRWQAPYYWAGFVLHGEWK
jgi:CHAT domain-containing protein/tetratricopeptide (TPR) repeat protein